tara:strand:- start:644 stop:1873 length:1230 start_codon:yes stop_codon:yes gene_type:complete
VVGLKEFFMKKILFFICLLFCSSGLIASDFDPTERHNVPLQESFSKGSENPSVTIVEFSAFNCPPCKRLAAIFDDVLKDYPEDVKLVFKHGVPRALELEKEAVLATWASGQQGYFWEMHDLLFESNDRSFETYLQYVEKLKLNKDKFISDFQSDAAILSIENEWRVSSCLGNYGTPNFFVNGKKYSGELWTHERIREIIDKEILLMNSMGNPQYEEIMEMSKGEDFLCGKKVFKIVPSLSQARFFVDEILREEPFTVIGETNSIFGSVDIDFDFPKRSSMGRVMIESNSFITDSNSRNRAIRNRILESNTYPSVSFQATRIDGIPEKATFYPGQKYELKISGELTIKDKTLFETFDAVLEIIDFSTIRGFATVDALWADYGVNVPQPPFVQLIEDSIRLEFEFIGVLED